MRIKKFNEIYVSESVEFEDFLDRLNINFDDFNLSPSNFDHKSDIHGVNHTFRVMFNVLMIGKQINDIKTTRQAFMAAYIHDMARTCDGICNVHGKNSAKLKLPLYKDLFINNGLDEEDINAIALAITNHSENFEIDKNHNYYKAVALLRDADALDLVRLGYVIKPELLRNKESINLIGRTEELYDRTEFKQWSKFSEFLQKNIDLL